MGELEIKQCAYCGRMFMCGEGEKPEDVCDCDGARNHMKLKAIYDSRLQALEKLCGCRCSEIDAAFKPLDDETLSALSQILYNVIYGEMSKAKIELKDGTQIEIARSAVRRKLTIVADLSD